MINTMRYTLFTAAILLAGITTSVAQTADEIVQKHIEAIGGKKKWRKVNSIKTTGTFTSDGAEVLFTTIKLDNEGIYKEFTYATTKKTAYEALTQKIGWRFIPVVGIRSRSEMFPETMVKKNQYTLDLQGPLIDYKSKGNKIEYVGKEVYKKRSADTGITCYKIRVTYNGGHSAIFYIDTVNYYHIRTTYEAIEHHQPLIVNGKRVEEQAASYSDFKMLPEGIVVPMTFSEGIGVQKINTVEINVDVDKKIFNPK